MDKIPEIIDQHNKLLEQYMQSKQNADMKAYEKDTGANGVDSAKTFPQELMDADRQLKDAGQPGISTPGAQEPGVLNRGPASFFSDLGKSAVDLIDPRTSILTAPFRSTIESKPSLETQAQPALDSSQVQSSSPESGTSSTIKPTVFPSSNIKAQDAEKIPMPESPKILSDAEKLVKSEKLPSEKEISDKLTLEAKAKEESALAGKKYVDEVIAQKTDLDAKILANNTRMDKVADDIHNIASIDPNRVWNNNSTMGKISFVISAMFGGLNTGGALKTIIDNDIDAQVKNQASSLDKNKGLLNIYMKNGEDLQSAKQHVESFYKTYADLTMQAKQAHIAADPKSIMIEANKINNANIKEKQAQELAIGKEQAVVAKTKQDAFKEQAKFNMEAKKNKLEADKFNAQQGILTPEQAKMSTLIDIAKQNHDKLATLESGLTGVDLTDIINSGIAAKYAQSGGAGAVATMFNNALTKAFGGKSHTSADTAKIVDYINSAHDYALQEMQLEGMRVTDANTIAKMRDIMSPNMGDRSLNKSAAERRLMHLEKFQYRTGKAGQKLSELNK
jgi:hypothetical protein